MTAEDDLPADGAVRVVPRLRPKPMEGQKVRRGSVSYEDSLEHDRQRAFQRELSEAFVDYVEGRKTPGAQQVADELARIARIKKEGQLAADLLRLMPEHRRIAVEEQKAKKQRADAEAKRRKKNKEPPPPPKNAREALVDEEIVDPGLLHGTRYKATVKSRGYALRGLPDQHRRAVERFASDYELAYQRTLRGAALTTKVDGGGGKGGAYPASIDAVGRIARLKKVLGYRDYQILKAVAIYDLGPTKIAEKTGQQKRVIGEEIRRVAIATASFYEGKQPPRKDRLVIAIDELIAEINQREPKTASGETGEEARKRRARA